MQLDIVKRAEDRMQKEQDRLQMIADDAIMEKTSHICPLNNNTIINYVSMRLWKKQ